MDQAVRRTYVALYVGIAVALLAVAVGWLAHAGALRGLGDTTFLLRTSLVLNWLFFVPLAYVLTFVADLGSTGAWLSLYAFLASFALALGIRFYRTDWTSVRSKQSAPHA
ncbi:hypothetical protein QJ48_10105 [Paenibacillus sp. A3]|uniref:hypothetical protein n=1 Tax=Paenibacillus sp. A3 TaxID=1337054 RepID=UPI0006D54C73|nr:hypothetical protein [Paenibacillus sp. A3]KPV59584.1 hypothetical protein QJ48_10105 [Paenibacillus sp. A3]